MYAFIEGQVCEKAAGVLVLLAGGVGYQLNCSVATLQAAPPIGETMRCYTYLAVRENAIDLFGFASREERSLFLSLTGVTGVGARTALALLGSMPLRELNLAILLGDVNALSRAPGVGKKTAQRIAMELKDKISQADVNAPDKASDAAPVAVASDSMADALEALIALGYSGTEARDALMKVKGQSDQTDELIRLALRALAGM